MLNKQFLLLPVFLVLTVSSAVAQDRAVPASQAQVQLSFAPLVRQVAPAVVNIYTKRKVERQVSPFMNDPLFAPFFQGLGGRMRQQVESALGSGVIVEADGLVVTNSHVVKDAQEITVVLSDGEEFPARVALADEASDVALLRVDTGGKTLPHINLRPSESLEVGDLVLAIGNPFGVGQTVTSGIVSAKGSSALDINDFNFFIQTDAAINPGNSGGPLVALDGGVVGINTAIYSRDGGSLGIGFAIPSEMVVSVMAAEKAGGRPGASIARPWLGVSAQSVTSDIAKSMNLAKPGGALIASLHPASPLAKAGMKTGDVVVSMGGKPVRDPGEMRFRMATVPIGGQTSVQAIRAGKALDFNISATPPPEEPPRHETVLSGRNILSGATVANVNPAVAVELGLDAENTSGVVVQAVERGSVAARLVRPGDILMEINRLKINRVEDVHKALKSAAPGTGFVMVVNSGGKVHQVVIR